ncbi:bicaudal D-related protein homolog isoform X2 [Tachypleus tridentatus]|uniref:bicaudal D-related protein homolog isoform X2 n=1 Tax=Tachypleus tridentatus TaxID=6853 RepID=UPI003FD29A3E
MCSCTLQDMQQPTSPNCHSIYSDIEDYLKKAENTKSDDDIYAELNRRENDLILAAELGKALLEKNDELSRANERLTEEYSSKLEDLEQEKYTLKRKLDVLAAEYDSRVAELQTDLNELRRELDEHRNLVKSTEKENHHVIQELQDQNQRLTEALKQIDMLIEKKADLENRIQELIEEKEGLSVSLEESNERVLVLERYKEEQDNQIRRQKKDLEELKQTNYELQNKLGNVLRRTSTPTFGETSIFTEIEMSSVSSVDEELRSLNGSQFGQSRPFTYSGSVGFQGDLDEDETEYDEAELSPFTGVLPQESEENLKFRQELADIYHQLRRLCEDLRRRRDSLSADSGVPPSPDDIEVHHIRVGMISGVLHELRVLMQELLVNCSDSLCMSCQTVENESSVVQKIREDLVDKTEELKKKSEEISKLTTKVSVQEAELAALKEERDRLAEDIGNTNMGKDQVVKKAWEVRDKAVARKNAVEIELAKTRIDVMQINSQLMEAIQQKVELSQQLEQWQVDMQSLLNEQLRAKLQNQEQEEKASSQRLSSNHRQKRGKGKLFGLWR